MQRGFGNTEVAAACLTYVKNASSLDILGGVFQTGNILCVVYRSLENRLQRHTSAIAC